MFKDKYPNKDTQIQITQIQKHNFKIDKYKYTNTNTMTMTMIKTFGEHPQIATPETFDL